MPETKEIDNPIGWIVLKNCMKPYDRQKFGGSVIIIDNNEKGASKVVLKNPSFGALEIMITEIISNGHHKMKNKIIFSN